MLARFSLWLALVFLPSFCAFAQTDQIDDQKAIQILTPLLENEAAARSHLAAVRETAARTPFSPLAVLVISRQLLVRGWKAKQAPEIIEGSANAACGTGVGEGGFTEIALSIGEMVDKSSLLYVTAARLERLNVPAWKALTYSWGKAPEELRSLALRSRITGPISIDALINGLNEMYAGAALREAKKVKGSIPDPPAPQPVQKPSAMPKTCFENGRKLPC